MFKDLPRIEKLKSSLRSGNVKHHISLLRSFVSIRW